MIVKPQAVGFDAWRRIEPLDAHRLEPFGETVEIVLERAERDMSELLARAFAEGHPDMRIAARLHRQEIAVFVDLESELAVEIPGDRKVGHGEMEPVDRMHAEFSRSPGRLDEAANFGHVASSRCRFGAAAGRQGSRRGRLQC